ncbi:hypothetical protein KP509_1Z061000 [Ceratopteris richardii]|nr:hypothetical protein KP509_1Z061000 [Ceratopteris richardii]
MAGHQGNVHIVTDQNDWEARMFEASTNSKLAVVYFTAPWCGPCRIIDPFFAELSEKYPNAVFLKVDVDDHEGIRNEYGVHAMPTFIFFIDSKPVDKIVGAGKGALEEKVCSLLEGCTATA